MDLGNIVNKWSWKSKRAEEFILKFSFFSLDMANGLWMKNSHMSNSDFLALCHINLHCAFITQLNWNTQATLYAYEAYRRRKNTIVGALHTVEGMNIDILCNEDTLHYRWGIIYGPYRFVFNKLLAVSLLTLLWGSVRLISRLTFNLLSLWCKSAVLTWKLHNSSSHMYITPPFPCYKTNTDMFLLCLINPPQYIGCAEITVLQLQLASTCRVLLVISTGWLD